MTESKLLEGDRDEWFYTSLERYTNLYMFELEFPVNAIEIIDDTSICLSGIQNYSKKCELLQLSIPPKLLPKNSESEGLCKDRDFKIISGGYASSRILQIKGIKSVKNFVATVQLGTSGVVIYELGNEEHAVIKERATISLPNDIETGVIDTFGNRIVAAGMEGTHLYEIRIDGQGNATQDTMKYKIPTSAGRITKLKFWDETTLSYITEQGLVALYDIRSNRFASSFPASSSLNDDDDDDDVEPTPRNPNLLFSFDCIPIVHAIGVVDSCGGYESFDVRHIKEEISRGILPGCSNDVGVLRGKFNIEYEPVPVFEDTMKFIVTGLQEDIVNIYEDDGHGVSITSVFSHDGHCKTVSHAMWHPTSDKLLISTSIDSVLHAWQYTYTPPLGSAAAAAAAAAEADALLSPSGID